MNFCLEPMSDRNKKREDNNKLRDQRKENRKEVKEAVIAA